MNNPKLSVVTVCYNAVDTIEETILSVINQTYQNVEYIIIDGVSTDGTIDIINKYRDKITHFVSEPDKGIYDAMNKGIKLAAGEWINFMNAGDLFFNTGVLNDVFAHREFSTNTQVVYGDVMLKFKKKEGIIKRLGDVRKELIPYNLNHQSTFTRLAILKQIGFDLSYKLAADAYSFHFISKQNGEFSYVPVTISIYECTEGVSSTHPIQLYKEIMRIHSVPVLSIKWIIGFLKASVFEGLSFLPTYISNKVISSYYYWKLRN